MIKKITLIGCEFCHKPYSNAAAAEADFMCDDCGEGQAERVMRDAIKKLESEHRREKERLEQTYSDWQAKNS